MKLLKVARTIADLDKKSKKGSETQNKSSFFAFYLLTEKVENIFHVANLKSGSNSRLPN